MIHKGRPAYISIEPTTNCNLNCPQCFTSSDNFTRPKGNIALTTFKEIIQQASPCAFYLNLYFQGEPFLNQNLIALISLAKQAKFYVSVSTNGHYLTENNTKDLIHAGLDRLIVSLDGTNAETYTQYRFNGSFDTVVTSIKLLVAEKQKTHKNNPFIELQFIETKKNENQAKEIKRLAKNLSVDKIKIKSLQLINFEIANEWLPQVSRYSTSNDGKIIIKSKLPNHCSRMWNSCVVTWDGNVIPCCFDKNANHIMGNVLNANLQDIWKDTLYQKFRKKVFSDRKNIEICNNCSEDL
ncbi:MAG: radical SAM/SPASM domain-containing protein [Bacteroidota bacterium]